MGEPEPIQGTEYVAPEDLWERAYEVGWNQGLKCGYLQSQEGLTALIQGFSYGIQQGFEQGAHLKHTEETQSSEV